MMMLKEIQSILDSEEKEYLWNCRTKTTKELNRKQLVAQKKFITKNKEANKLLETQLFLQGKF